MDLAVRATPQPRLFTHFIYLQVLVLPTFNVGCCMDAVLSLSPNIALDLASANDRTMGIYDFFKRGLDILVAGALLIALSPLLVVLAIAVRCSSSGPAMFKQLRLTKNGKAFRMYKFRTMRADAEAASGAVFATVNDPRITSIGKFMRRSRLDELPQLFNVLRGEMSLVGPRPERPELVPDLVATHPHFEQRLKVRAGLTGLAQVSVGYSSSARQYRHKLTCDRLYIENRCLFLDLWILFKTVAVVLTGKGAC